MGFLMRIFIQNEIQKLSSDFTHSNVFLCKQESRKLKKDWIITGTEMTGVKVLIKMNKADFSYR